MNRLGWIPAKYFCPAWVGEKVGNFKKGIKFCDYEFVRGSIPKANLEPLKKRELEVLDFGWKIQKDRA